MLALTESSSNVSDVNKNIVEKAKSGDRAAFSEIVRSYQRKIFYIAYGYFMNRDDAMEIMQETFLKAYQGISRLNDVEKLNSWLCTITNNLCRDQYRKLKRRDWKNTEFNNAMTNKIIDKTDLKDNLQSQKIKDELKSSIANLPHRQKVIVVMRHFQDLTYREIAENLGRKIGTVKRLHFEAMNKLRKSLEEYSR